MVIHADRGLGCHGPSISRARNGDNFFPCFGGRLRLDAPDRKNLTTDDTDGTDKDRERKMWVAADRFDLSHPCHPCHPWLKAFVRDAKLQAVSVSRAGIGSTPAPGRPHSPARRSKA